MIITEENYIPYKNINLDNPQTKPNIIFYPSIYDNIKEPVINFLDSIEYVPYNGKEISWFSENATWNYISDIKPQPIPGFLIDIKHTIEKLTEQTFNSCLVSKYDKNQYHKFDSFKEPWLKKDFIIPTVYYGKTRKILFKNNSLKKVINPPNGSVIIFKELFNKYWEYYIPKSKKDGYLFSVSFFNIPEDYVSQKEKKVKRITNKLEIIYLQTKYRILYGEYIKKKISSVHYLKYKCMMKNNINQLSDFFKIKKLIGSGDWGNVFSSCLSLPNDCKYKFAIKMSRITNDNLKDLYSSNNLVWYETWMLRDIFKKILQNNICPNLPNFIDTFVCDKCDFILRKDHQTHPCVITVTELASGDLHDYFSYNNTAKEIYSCLFQILAGLHAIQMHGQIQNRDIKAKNILFYNVKPGGYWQYKINNKNYYVPNYGTLFILNDFGVSSIYNPDFQLFPNEKTQEFNLGSRFAININGIFSPLNAEIEYHGGKMNKSKPITWVTKDNEHINSKGIMYKIDKNSGIIKTSKTTLTSEQKNFLFSKNLCTNPKKWDFFNSPFYIPPFEFYNDLQDTLRIFTGGLRSVQRGNHKLYNIPQTIRTKINKYRGNYQNSKLRYFSLYAYEVLAGEFISKFFTKEVNYTKKPSGSRSGPIYVDDRSIFD